MATLSALVRALLLVLLLAHVNLSACVLLKGFIACTDCKPDHDLSGIEVSVKCSNKRWESSLTNKKGYFEVETSTEYELHPSPSCIAMILGGPTQLYALKKNMISKVVNDQTFYALSTPLAFFTARPLVLEVPVSNEKAPADVGSSKTIGPFSPGGVFALPPSFYRFLPIIGIP